MPGVCEDSRAVTLWLLGALIHSARDVLHLDPPFSWVWSVHREQPLLLQEVSLLCAQAWVQREVYLTWESSRQAVSLILVL